jgi:UDP-GlcNAc:undecaprenyl-phosphate/decaprenyl-phosphate GlcNAc-1-phosphate transferase
VTLLLLVSFCLALFFSLLSTQTVRNLARARGWLDKPVLDRHVHTIALPRIGGVAIFVSFLAAVGCAMLIERWSHPIEPVAWSPIFKLVGPATIVFLLGIYDDLHSVSPATKFLVQAFAATLLFLGGYGVHRFDLFSASQSLQSYVGLPLTIFWVLLITNAFNLIDGLDGLAAGSALFSTAVIFILSIFTPDPIVSLLAVVLAGAILGFLRFNFHPASIFLGDSGSLFIGFLISALAIAGSQKAPTIVAVSIPLLSLGLPILDVALAIARRFISGKPIFRGDRDHIHHKLLSKGFSQREAVLLLYGITAGFGFISLVLLHHASAIALILALTGTGVLVGVQQLRYTEFGEMLSLVQRATRRRQIVANHVAIRNAVESLDGCNDFRSICEVLQKTLQPLGFDGICFEMLHPNGFSPSSFLPLLRAADGKLSLWWADGYSDQPPWELRLKLVAASQNCWGHVSLIRASVTQHIPLDVNVLSGELRAALSQALTRTCERMEEAFQIENHQPTSPKYAAASSGL